MRSEGRWRCRSRPGQSVGMARSPGPAARRLLDAGANVIGMNCQPGIDAAVAFAERLHGQVGLSLARQAKRGEPSRTDLDPASFAAAVPKLLDLERPSARGLLRNLRGPRGGAGGRLRPRPRRRYFLHPGETR